MFLFTGEFGVPVVDAAAGAAQLRPPTADDPAMSASAANFHPGAAHA